MMVRKLALLMLVSILFLPSGLAVGKGVGGSQTSFPDDYNCWGDCYFSIRTAIGYGDIEYDPWAHGFTAFANNYELNFAMNCDPALIERYGWTAVQRMINTPLGDSSMPIGLLVALCAAAFAGAAAADRMRRA